MFTLNELLGHGAGIFALLPLLSLTKQFWGSLRTGSSFHPQQNSGRLFQRFCAFIRSLRIEQRSLFNVYGSYLREVHLPRQHLIRKWSG